MREVHSPRGAGESPFDLFEGDGVRLAYQQGAYRLIRLRMQADEQQVIKSSRYLVRRR
ncbi:MAG: DUF5110 domain-containing protein [Chloroflexi bacterium]|jgi:hypothetical protein|nr:DUF5110 domain-containing protein [Chloroflexota bacterium]